MTRRPANTPSTTRALEADEALARLVLTALHGIDQPARLHLEAAVRQVRRDRDGALWHVFDAPRGVTPPRPDLWLDRMREVYLGHWASLRR